MLATGGCGLVFGRSTNSMACNGSAASRMFQAGARYANGEFVQVHPTAIPGADKLRLISESAAAKAAASGCPRRPQDPRRAGDNSRERALLFPRRALPEVRQSAAARHRHARDFQGLHRGGTERPGRPDVRLSRRDAICRATCWTASWPAFWKSTRSSRAPIPRTTPMKIFPAVHYSMGGLWCDYEANGGGGLAVGSPRNQQTNVPGVFAIGECDYQFHGANRLGANSLVACLFSGLTVAPGMVRLLDNLPGGTAAEQPASLFDRAAPSTRPSTRPCWPGRAGGPNPTASTPNWGEVMTKAATVIRHNADLRDGLRQTSANWSRRPGNARWPTRAAGPTRTWSSRGRWRTCFRWPRRSCKGALARDECRGAALQAGVRHAGDRRHRTGRAPPRRPKRGAGGSRRTIASG